MKYFKSLVFCFLVIPAFTISAQIHQLKEISLFEDKLQIKVPIGFEVMSEELLKIKYPISRRPTLAYSNEKGNINVAFNLTPSPANQELIETYKNTFVKTFKSFYPSAEWKNQGIKNINGQNVGYLELITPAADTNIYNLIFFTNLNDKLLLCTFNCSEEILPEWKSTAAEIMNSLNVKK